MSIKSTFNATKPSGPKRPTLPHLFKDNRTAKVVLFIEERTGAVIHGHGVWKPGDSTGGWASCWDTSYWTPLKPGESVTITVEED